MATALMRMVAPPDRAGVSPPAVVAVPPCGMDGRPRSVRRPGNAASLSVDIDRHQSLDSQPGPVVPALATPTRPDSDGTGLIDKGAAAGLAVDGWTVMPFDFGSHSAAWAA